MFCANDCKFNDELIKDKEEGGMKAARMLNEAVEKYLRDALPEARNCRFMVRIYADLTELSKLLAKSKLVGLEKRSLAAFAAGFTRAINLFDFVDALDEEGTKFKIRGMLCCVNYHRKAKRFYVAAEVRCILGKGEEAPSISFGMS